MSHPSLTPAQAERLEMLIEEAAEVSQAATKILRHGFNSHNPNRLDRLEPEEPNGHALEREVADLIAVLSAMGHARDIHLLEAEGLYSAEASRTWTRKLRWTHHQGAPK